MPKTFMLVDRDGNPFTLTKCVFAEDFENGLEHQSPSALVAFDTLARGKDEGDSDDLHIREIRQIPKSDLPVSFLGKRPNIPEELDPIEEFQRLKAELVKGGNGIEELKNSLHENIITLLMRSESVQAVGKEKEKLLLRFYSPKDGSCAFHALGKLNSFGMTAVDQITERKKFTAYLKAEFLKNALPARIIQVLQDYFHSFDQSDGRFKTNEEVVAIRLSL